MAYTSFSPARTANAMAGAQDLFAQMVSSISAWNQTRRTRDALNKLSDHELEDIGLARGDIEAVALKRSL